MKDSTETYLYIRRGIFLRMFPDGSVFPIAVFIEGFIEVFIESLMAPRKQQQQRKARKEQAQPTMRASVTVKRVVSATILGLGLYRAIDLRWVSDDAYITFRYVKNFLAGNGLVYNVGERVEGYTHFLWLMIVAALQWVGIDPVTSSEWIGIGCFGATILLLLLIADRESDAGRRSTFFPLAAAMLALNYDMAIWATGGLETALFALLILLALFVWFYTSLTEQSRLLLLGCTLLVATLTRPDGALFIAAALTLVIYREWKRASSIRTLLKNSCLFLLPIFVVGIPYLLWKLSYYGDILPNTYYAKSAGNSDFGQGVFYVWLFLKVYFAAALVIVGFLSWKLIDRQHSQANTQPTPESGHETEIGTPLSAAAFAVLIYTVIFVIRTGGDFMFARFMIPVLPLIYFIVERIVDRLPYKLSRHGLAISLLLICFVVIENGWRERVLFHTDPETAQLEGNWDGKSGGETRGIADERWVYMRKRFNLNGVERGSLDVYSDIGRYYAPFFKGLPVTIAISGAQNSIAYYADFPTVIDQYGLTDSYVAHLPITQRGRMGHEKEAPEAYLKKRGVEFELFAVTPEFPKTPGYDLAVFELPQFGIWQLVKIINYDSSIVNELTRRFRAAGNRSLLPNFSIIIPSYLDRVMPTETRSQVAEDYEGFKKLYLDRYPNPALQKRFEDYIAGTPVRDTAKHSAQ